MHIIRAVKPEGERRVNRNGRMMIVSELLSVLNGKEVSLTEAKSIAHLFREEVEKKSAAQLDRYEKAGTFRAEIEEKYRGAFKED